MSRWAFDRWDARKSCSQLIPFIDREAEISSTLIAAESPAAKNASYMLASQQNKSRVVGQRIVHAFTAVGYDERWERQFQPEDDPPWYIKQKTQNTCPFGTYLVS